mmetsp:Transcript_1852/g.4685  ORF Transcript_1852/g.4685 Transcript_1852/m.4685 type:complete len:200 (+) Transcript_1852:359-958(+)
MSPSKRSSSWRGHSSVASQSATTPMGQVASSLCRTACKASSELGCFSFSPLPAGLDPVAGGNVLLWTIGAVAACRFARLPRTSVLAKRRPHSFKPSRANRVAKVAISAWLIASFSASFLICFAISPRSQGVGCERSCRTFTLGCDQCSAFVRNMCAVGALVSALTVCVSENCKPLSATCSLRALMARASAKQSFSTMDN